MRNLIKIRSCFWIIVAAVSLSFIVMQGCSSDNGGSTEPTKKGPLVVLSPEVLYFGYIPEEQTASREFIIFNTGDEPLVISQMEIVGSDTSSFSLIGNSGEITVPINKILTFGVSFDPSETGSFSAQVSIVSNAKTSPDLQELAGNATSMAGNITFERIIGDADNDNDGNIRVLNDGGFIIAGSSLDKEEEVNVATLTRLDEYGNVKWSKQYPVAGLSGFSGIVVTASENFVCTGSTQTGVRGKSSIFALSTDEDGNDLWEYIYDLGGIQDDFGNEITRTTQGGYIIAGSTKNTDDAIGGVKDAILIRIDNNGDIEWTKKYGTREGEEAISVKQTRSGGYIFAGSTTVPSTQIGGDFDYYMVKTDADGNQLWSKIFGGENLDFASSIIIDELGGYVMAGYTASKGAGARDYWVVKTDTSGGLEWDQTYGGPGDDGPSEIIQTNDGGFFITGGSESFSLDGTGDMWVVKTNNNGTEEWNKVYGGESNDGGSSAREVGNGFIISGGTSSFGINNDIYVIKANSDGSYK